MTPLNLFIKQLKYQRELWMSDLPFKPYIPNHIVASSHWDTCRLKLIMKLIIIIIIIAALIKRTFQPSELHTIITLVTGYNFKTALNFHSPGSIPCRAANHGATGKCILHIHTWIFCILPGPHFTPGSRAAMWINCLAEGQKCQR